MPRYEDRYGSTTRLYVGHLSSRTRSRDLEQIFARYGRVRDVDMKRDYAFVEFSDPRDADDARYSMDGRDVDGRRITVEFAKGVPRGPGGVKEYVGRGPAPGSGRCFNCGLDGHWARDCKAGDWKNKCYRCGERGHIERNCQNSPKKLSGRGRSYSRSPARSRSRSRSPRRGHGQSRSFSRSPSRSRSPARRGRDVEYEEKRSRSRSPNERRQRSPARRVRDTENDDKRSRSRSPDDRRREPRRRGASPYESERRSLTPDRDAPMDRSLSPVRGKRDREQDGYGESQRETSRSPVEPRYEESPYAKNGREFTPSPREDREPVEDENGGSPQGSESP